MTEVTNNGGGNAIKNAIAAYAAAIADELGTGERAAWRAGFETAWRYVLSGASKEPLVHPEELTSRELSIWQEGYLKGRRATDTDPGNPIPAWRDGFNHGWDAAENRTPAPDSQDVPEGGWPPARTNEELRAAFPPTPESRIDVMHWSHPVATQGAAVIAFTQSLMIAENREEAEEMIAMAGEALRDLQAAYERLCDEILALMDTAAASASEGGQAEC